MFLSTHLKEKIRNIFTMDKEIMTTTSTTNASITTPTTTTTQTLVVIAVTSVSSLSVIYVVGGLAWRYWKFKTNPLRNVPEMVGPEGDNSNDGTSRSSSRSSSIQKKKPPSFLFGQFFTIRKEPFMVPHQRWIESSKLGYDAPFVFYTLMFGKSCICLLDKNIVKTVLMAQYSKEPLRFIKDIRFLQNVVGDGLVTLQGTSWMRHRSIIQPAFMAQALNQMLTDIIPPLTMKLVSSWRLAKGREIELSTHLSALTLEVIGHAAFSHEFHALDTIQKWAETSSSSADGDNSGVDNSDGLSEINDPFVKAFTQAFQFSIISTISFILGMPFISRYFNPQTRRARKAMDNSVDAIIDEAKAKEDDSRQRDSTTTTTTTSRKMQPTRTSLSRTRKSLLELLVGARDGESRKSLNDVELRDEIKTFLFAGHETTSTWCYGAVWSLCSFPEVQDKVYQDILKHSPPNRDEPLDLETVENMEYFSAFMQEVLRMFPPIGMILRSTTKEETFDTPYTVPAGTRITIPIYLLHRHPKYWDDPETFRPERWIFTDDNERKAFMSKIQFAFLPFSSGARNCIGERFAKIEAHLIMAELIRNFRFQIAPSQRDTTFTLSNVIALKTKPRLKVVLKSR